MFKKTYFLIDIIYILGYRDDIEVGYQTIKPEVADMYLSNPIRFLQSHFCHSGDEGETAQAKLTAVMTFAKQSYI